MTEFAYSHALRILACAQCGAPLEVSVDGGAFVCTYCGCANQLARRDESGDRARAAEAAVASISESERFARLREQAKQGEALPASIQELLENGKLPAHQVDAAKAEWLRARTEIGRTPTFPLSERLFHLTVLLTVAVDSRAQRALLETAIELLPDDGHRHILRCMMARLAARAADLPAASEWLAPCNTRALDLAMDSAYRHAAATIAAVAGDHEQVLALLGAQRGDVPLAERDELGCGLLRVHALEERGRLDEAVIALLEIRGDIGHFALREALAEPSILHFCGRTRAAIASIGRRETLEQLRSRQAQLEARYHPWRALRDVGLGSAILATPIALLAFVVNEPYSASQVVTITAGSFLGVFLLIGVPAKVWGASRARHQRQELQRQIDDLAPLVGPGLADLDED